MLLRTIFYSLYNSLKYHNNIMNKYIIGFVIVWLILIVKYEIHVKNLCNMQIVELNQIYDELHTGDLILCIHDHLADVNLLKYLGANIYYYFSTGKLFTHSGIVVKDDTNNKAYIYTATDTPFFDKYTQSYKTGTVLTELTSVVEPYEGRIFIYKLIPSIDNTNDVINYIHDNTHKVFNTNIIEMFNVSIKLWKNKYRPDKTICSQTVTESLQALHIISEDAHSPNIGPADIANFAEDSGLYHPPILINNYYLKN